MSKIFKPPYNLIIYAGGKCGGTTLHFTFLKIWFHNFKSIHIHNNNCFMESQRIGTDLYPQTDNPISIFDCVDTNKKTYFIDVYRNPIDRKISSYFQNLEHNRTYFNVPKNLSISEEVDFFQMNVFHNIEDYESFSEVLSHYKIPTLKYKNDYWIQEKDNNVFIKLKFSNIHRWDDILSDIFKIRINIVSENLSSNKKYYKTYKLFKKIYYDNYN